MKWAQICVIALQVLGCIGLLYGDINGRPAKEPSGFPGVIVTLVIVGLVAWLYSAAGLYSAL